MKYDAVVIGSGAAGLYFSLAYSSQGKKVAIVEIEKLGGTAFTTGCLPVKKIMDKIKSFRKAEILEKEGLVRVNKDMNLLYESGKKSIESTENFIKDKLNKNNIDIYIGKGEILKNKKVKINENIIEGENIIIASGSSPCNLENSSQIDEDVILSHKGILSMKDLPKEITILGGNVEGIEFASLLSELGVKITVIEREDDILKGNDLDLIENIRKRLELNKVKFLLKKEVINVKKIGNSAVINIKNEDSLKTKKLLITGIRKCNIPNGLDKLGIEIENRHIKVDENLMTSEDGIYCVGDANGIHGMAHIAVQQGILLSDYLLYKKKISFNYNSLPRCIFTLNELAGAGYQENQLSGCEVKKIYFKDTFRGLNNTFDDSFMKIIIKNEKIKGIWINSIDAGNFIGNIGLWIDREIDIDDIKNSLFINPTLAEGLIDALIK